MIEEMNKKPAYNSTYPTGDGFVFHDRFSAENPCLRQARNRYASNETKNL
jgi:hypothetical protein